MAEDLPYQLKPQVEQLLAERANADAYGQADTVARIDKTLDGLGYKQAGKKRAKAAEDDDEAKTEAPKGRTAHPKQTT